MYRGNKKVKMTSERTTTGINDQCDSLKVGNKRKVERKKKGGSETKAQSNNQNQTIKQSNNKLTFETLNVVVFT